MKRCPHCGEKVKHYSTKRICETFTKRYYKCNCGISFTTSHNVIETVIRVYKRGENGLSSLRKKSGRI